jgi:hypothetical protein
MDEAVERRRQALGTGHLRLGGNKQQRVVEAAIYRRLAGSPIGANTNRRYGCGTTRPLGSPMHP